MIIKFKTEQLHQIIENLFDLTGIAISVLDADYNILTNCSNEHDYCSFLQKISEEKKHCELCDHNLLERCRRSKKLEYHLCWSELCDAAMPLLKYDTIVGFVIMGRIRSVKCSDFPAHICDKYHHVSEQLKQLYLKLPIMTEKQLSALYELLPSILFDSAIQVIYDPLIDKIVQFIHDNLKENLSVKLICSKFNISTNHLYEIFRNNLDTTVNEYIIEQRLAQAKKMIISSNDPIYTIAENVGINNYTYFCKLFKNRHQISPIEYRKASKN